MRWRLIKQFPVQGLLRARRVNLSANSTNDSTNEICTFFRSFRPLPPRNMTQDHTRIELYPPASRQNLIVKESVARISRFVRRNDNAFPLLLLSTPYSSLFQLAVSNDSSFFVPEHLLHNYLTKIMVFNFVASALTS